MLNERPRFIPIHSFRLPVKNLYDYCFYNVLLLYRRENAIIHVRLIFSYEDNIIIVMI